MRFDLYQHPSTGNNQQSQGPHLHQIQSEMSWILSTTQKPFVNVAEAMRWVSDRAGLTGAWNLRQALTKDTMGHFLEALQTLQADVNQQFLPTGTNIV